MFSVYFSPVGKASVRGLGFMHMLCTVGVVWCGCGVEWGCREVFIVCVGCVFLLRLAWCVSFCIYVC